MSGITYTKFHEDATTVPNDSATSSFSFGFNVPTGPLESIILRMTASVSTNAVLADYPNVISNLRLTLNGEVAHDFRQAVNGGSNNNPSAFGYFLNSIGGRAVEKPSDTAKECYMVIPIGRQIAESVGRLEVVIGFGQTAAAVASGSFQVWGRFNTATQTMTTVSPATSFNHSASIEQVVVRIPQNVPGVVAGILVQNDSAEDDLGSQGIRLMAQSAYGLDADFLRTFNGDLYNGVLYADDDASTTQLTYAQEVAGGLFLPTLNLVGGDVVLQVDSSAITVRTYTPVMVAPFNAKDSEGVRQTATISANTSTAILGHVE